MKKINQTFKSLFLILPLFIFGQSKSDTIYLKNTKDNKIYFENNKYSKFYNEINDFTFADKNEICLNWVSFQKYKNKYYLYMPCDKGNLNKVSISNSQISINAMELYNFKIKNFKISNNYYKYTGFIDDTNVKMKLEIKIIDEINQIAVFKYTNYKSKSIDYRLMIKSNNINSFEIIINECFNEKVKEVEFDILDLEKTFREF